VPVPVWLEAGVVPELVGVDVWVTEVVPAVVGEVVLFGSVLTAGALAGARVVVVSDRRTSIDGFEPPLPTEGAVVVGAAATVVAVVAVAGAVVVGVVAGATVVTVVPLVPWVAVWLPAGDEAGAVSAEADRAFSTRTSPARSMSDATHLRGLTTSILRLVLIGRNRPPWWDCGRGGPATETQGPAAGTRAVNHGPNGAGKHLLGLLTCMFVPVGGCWTDQRIPLERPLLPGGRGHPAGAPVVHRSQGQTISAVIGATASGVCS
jgi:hypothetical protein